MLSVTAQRGLFAALCLLLAAFPGVQGKPSRDCQKFELTLTWEKHAPDGFERDMMLVNGQFPGPLMEIDQGDDVEVIVLNQTPYNTTVHCHGKYGSVLRFNEYHPHVSQASRCSILPGQTEYRACLNAKSNRTAASPIDGRQRSTAVTGTTPTKGARPTTACTDP